MQDLQIGSIRVRAENLTPDQGQQLGERIAALLVEQLAQGDVAQREVGHVRARVTARGGESVELLAMQVVAAIIAAL